MSVDQTIDELVKTTTPTEPCPFCGTRYQCTVCHVEAFREMESAASELLALRAERDRYEAMLRAADCDIEFEGLGSIGVFQNDKWGINGVGDNRHDTALQAYEALKEQAALKEQ